MARKKITQADSMYAGARWQPYYPDVYSRTSENWQTRTGRRNRSTTTFANLLGLNTAFDDLHRLDGESPYLRNVRYMGEKQRYQRAQVSSRSGNKFISSIGDVDKFTTKNTDAYLELYEGKVIRFRLRHEGTLTRLQFAGIMNMGATGRLRVLLKKDENSRPICDANIDLADFATKNRKWEQRVVRFMQAMTQEMDGGECVIQLEIMDDVLPSNSHNMVPNQQNKVRILCSGSAQHDEAYFILPNQDDALRETPPTWESKPSIPLVGYTYNTLKPVELIIGDNYNRVLKVNKVRYVLSVVKDTYFDVKEAKEKSKLNFYRTDLASGKNTKIDADIDARATLVMGAKCKDYFYYVDGYSELQRINLRTWKGEVAMPKKEDIDTATDPKKLKAQKGAQLLWHMKNRIYLAGFKEDPNFVQFSLINSMGDGVQYDQFNEYFYSPDRSSKETTSPITALMSDITEEALLVFREDGCEACAVTGGLEFAKAQKVDTAMYNIGVAKQHDVCTGNGNVFLYNKSEGLRRYSGAEATFQSRKVDNELRRMPNSSDRFMVAHANKVWFAFDRNSSGYADHVLIYHTILSQQSPWYMDNNVPVKWMLGDQESDTIYACHANYPCIFIYGEENTSQDFNSSIEMEYDTSYNSTGDPNGWTILRRVIVRVISNDTRSWFIGVDIDKRDDPAVWRKYVSAVNKVDNGADAVFEDGESYRISVINCFMRRQCRSFNIRVKTYSWKGTSMLEYISAEIGGKMAR